MKKIKYIMAILVFIVVILIVILLIHKDRLHREDNTKDSSNIETSSDINSIKYQEYFAILNSVSKYLSVLDKNNIRYYEKNGDEYKFVATKNEIAENLLALLSEGYKNNRNIDKSNVINKIEMKNESEIITITRLKKLIVGNVNSYFIQGFTSTNDDKYLRDISFIVNLDTINKTFSVEELDSNVDYTNTSIEKVNEIEKNSYNGYVDGEVKTLSIINKYIRDLRTMMLDNPKAAYKLLDTEYRENRFNTYQSFEDYIERNREDIQTLSAQGYKINNYDNYTEYIIIDKYGNYYRFFEDSELNYNIMLDVYTTELPQFTEQYNNATNEQKVSMNIEKFIQMINSQDFEEAYQLLDDTYKSNSFHNLNDFIKYIQDNFNRYNTLEEVEDIKKVGKYYTCTAVIGNTIFRNDEPIERSFVISLGEGTDFKMAINLDY